MITQSFAILAIAIVAVFARPGPGWNELVDGEGLFDSSLNAIQVKSVNGNDAAVLEEFTNLLAQDAILENVYMKYRSVYKDAHNESPLRLDLFKNQLLKIAAHNLEANSGKHSWWMGVNQFSDLTAAEADKLTVPETYDTVNATRNPYRSTSGVSAPPSYDFNSLNKVSPVKNSKGGASGAYFAAVDAVESVVARRAFWPRGIPLSVQQLVDCMPQFCANAECKGNRVDVALLYISRTCLYAWSQYAYNDPPSRGTCQYKTPVTCLDPAGQGPYGDSRGNSDEGLKELIYQKGPVVALVHISNEMRLNYGKGVYAGTECGTSNPNQAVAVVGYGTEGGKDYWLIKNSWGQRWGEQGFLKLEINGSSVCRILDVAYWVNPGYIISD